jgi:signal transduction histidine kinase
MDVDLTRRKQAEALTLTQMQVLEMIAQGCPLTETFDALLRLMEAKSPEMLGSILMLDPDKVHVRHVAAPSLPPEFIRAVDGQAIGPRAGSCGTAMFRGEPVFVADIAADPLWTDYKDIALVHGLRACWSTPIFDAQKKVLGTFAIYSRTPRLPDEAERQFIEMATHTAAVCLSKHRTETERTQSIAREQQARIEYTFQLIAAQEAERKRIAAELHDSLGQNLLLIKNLAQMALREQEPAHTYERVASIDHLAAQCIAETRQISRDLHPHQLDHLGLKRALESMLESVSSASTIELQWKVDAVDELFSTEGAMNLYRVVQESLNNILKHSRAKTARVDLERDIHEVQLRIVDDGCGFLPDRLAENKKGLGLKNIPERVRMLGGKWKVDSAPGGGTRIEVVIPIIAEPE